MWRSSSHFGCFGRLRARLTDGATCDGPKSRRGAPCARRWSRRVASEMPTVDAGRWNGRVGCTWYITGPLHPTGHRCAGAQPDTLHNLSISYHIVMFQSLIDTLGLSNADQPVSPSAVSAVSCNEFTGHQWPRCTIFVGLLNSYHQPGSTNITAM